MVKYLFATARIPRAIVRLMPTDTAPPKRVEFILRLDPDEHARATRLAKRDRVPLSQWVREAIRARFKETGRKVAHGA